MYKLIWVEWNTCFILIKSIFVNLITQRYKDKQEARHRAVKVPFTNPCALCLAPYALRLLITSLTCTHFLHIILFTSRQKVRHLGIKGEANGKFEKKARKIENHL